MSPPAQHKFKVRRQPSLRQDARFTRKITWSNHSMHTCRCVHKVVQLNVPTSANASCRLKTCEETLFFTVLLAFDKEVDPLSVLTEMSKIRDGRDKD